MFSKLSNRDAWGRPKFYHSANEAGLLHNGNDEYTKLLLHFDETNAVWTDSSSTAKTVVNSSTTASTANKKFGAASCNMAAGHIYVPASTDFATGSGDFCYDGWFYINTDVRQGLIAFQNDIKLAIDISSVGGTRRLGFWASSNGSSWDILQCDTAGVANSGNGTIQLANNAWNHIEFGKFGTRWMGFVNGILDMDKTRAGYALCNVAAQNFNIGRYGDGAVAGFTGLVDEFRFSNCARHTASFNPLLVAYN